MSERFSMVFKADPQSRLLRVTATGPIDSRAYVDRCIAFYNSIDEVWAYDRLYDQTQSSGFVAFEDLDRLVKAMAPIWGRARTQPRVALANPKKLASARFGLVTQLVQKPNHQLFDTLEEAEAWLAEPHDRDPCLT